jgi:hypothetical protein
VKRGAIDVCSALERREAAHVRAELASATRCAEGVLAERTCLDEARVDLAFATRWTAQHCAIVDLRAVRATAAIGRLSAEIDAARGRAGAHEAQRRRWAAFVRGLVRRRARLEARTMPCPD